MTYVKIQLLASLRSLLRKRTREAFRQNFSVQNRRVKMELIFLQSVIFTKLSTFQARLRRGMFYFAALVEHPKFLYNKLKTRGDGKAVGVGVATPYFLQYSEGEARKGEAVKCANVPRPYFANQFPARILYVEIEFPKLAFEV